MSWVDRADELAELRLGSEEELREWREKRHLGKVKVELDHEYVDEAERVLGVRVETGMQNNRVTKQPKYGIILTEQRMKISSEEGDEKVLRYAEFTC
ncbi:MAG: hypothetical protein ACYCVD_19550 [Desulfitobacteriaceae bacterium]